MTAKSVSTSAASRLEVGSSRIRTFDLVTMARLIATSCCNAIEMDCRGARGSRSPRPISVSTSWARAWVLRQSMPKRERLSWPSMTFSPMVRLAQRLTSWYTVEIPAACADAVPEKRRSSPKTRIDPESIW